MGAQQNEEDGSKTRINFRAAVRIVCGAISFGSFILLLYGLGTLQSNLSSCKNRHSVQKVPDYVDSDNAHYSKAFYYAKSVCADTENNAQADFYANGTVCSALPNMLSHKRYNSSLSCYTGGVAYISCKNIELAVDLAPDNVSSSVLAACAEASKCKCNDMCVAYAYCYTEPGVEFSGVQEVNLLSLNSCQPLGCMLSASSNSILILRSLAVAFHIIGVFFPLKSMIKNKFKPKRQVIYSWLESDFYLFVIIFHFQDAVSMAPVNRRKYCLYGIFYTISPILSLVAAFFLYYDLSESSDLILIIFNLIMIFKRILFSFKECLFCARGVDAELKNNDKMTIGVSM